MVSLCYGTTLSSRVWCVYILWHRRIFYISRTTPKTAVHLRCLRCPSAGPSPGRALYRVPARSVSADGCGGGSAGGIRPLFAGGVFSVTILWYTGRKNAGGYHHGRNEPGPAGGRAGRLRPAPLPAARFDRNISWKRSRQNLPPPKPRALREKRLCWTTTTRISSTPRKSSTINSPSRSTRWTSS